MELQLLSSSAAPMKVQKTDGRKEFQRMLTYVKQKQGKVTHILVYMLDRFSRTGGAAIKLAEDLREIYGVDIIAVIQPADTSNAGGILPQSIQFLFSRYDNDIKRQRVITGMRDKLKKGIWVTKPPVGYDIKYTNSVRKIEVNEIGKKLRLAFNWKSNGVINQEILERLLKFNIRMRKQQLSFVFKNPFYCGLLTHSLLDGKMIEGSHETLVSKENFLRINQINEEATGYGVPHLKEQESLPLKVFAHCSHCNQPFTGYVDKQ